MPFAACDDARIYWRLEGEAGLPALVLLTSIGTDMALYDAAVPHLLPRFRLLRIDTRGHGASDAPSGDYSLTMLADDVLAVMDAAGIGAATLCGISLGGMIAMQVALQAPGRVDALVLACTSAAMDRAAWQARLDRVQAGGMAAIVDMALERFFSPAFRAHAPATVETTRTALLRLNPVGYVGCGAAIRDMDLLPRLGAITAPTLVIAGTQDISTPFDAHGAHIVAGIPRARSALLPTAHLPSLEDPAGFAALIRDFTAPEATEPGDAARTLYEAGLVVRRRVLGDNWVDRSLASRTDFTADYQAMITRIAWQEIWGRPGLDHRTRRLLVLAICAALARWEEFRLHVRAGLQQGGFTRDELKEVLMQTAIYAGVPAANTGFTEAAAILAALDQPGA